MTGGLSQPQSPDPLSAGREALVRGAWEEARACFEAVLAQGETPEALEGLSWAAWWIGDAELVFDARERAYRLYRARADNHGAARMAIWLGSDSIDFRGEAAVASGWRQRARRLLQGLELAPEHGWLTVFEGDAALQMGEDPAAARRLAEEAVEVGRRLGVIDLEMLALALQGFALVSEGQVDDGMRCLDEATAAATGGEFEEIWAVVWTCCLLIYACERVRDYDRAAQWCEKMKEFAARLRIRFMLGTCRVHYAGVLLWRGTWTEAEAELASATEDLLASRPPWAAEGLVRLAELRRRQGRVQEAAQLFEQVEGHPLTLLGRAELAIDQGKPSEAEELLERFLRRVPLEDKTQRAAALELLVRVQAMLGDHARAASTLATLQSISAAIPTQPLCASTRFAEGVVAVASGDYTTARGHFEDAAALFERSGAPFDTARSRLELAGVLSALGRVDAAEKEARAALETFRRIGAAGEAERAAALWRTLEASRQRRAVGADSDIALTQREIEVLRLVAAGHSDREIAEQLVLSEHTVHRHVANIRAKLDLPSRAAAVGYAARHGLV